MWKLRRRKKKLLHLFYLQLCAEIKGVAVKRRDLAQEGPFRGYSGHKYCFYPEMGEKKSIETLFMLVLSSELMLSQESQKHTYVMSSNSFKSHLRRFVPSFAESETLLQEKYKLFLTFFLL